ncbi:D-sedoheptulose 7-phosphate isomerase [Thermosipho ferrireducens]|uniref:Phosphoheptose isomerase n=1 Tax=Thermosipho ferrireducens TaxID=2571116 RepID=A0ABX7SAX5_9BACT|nr:D-sedoheptulose 7-phosphate isomerase [Thermosipho ferrireducens]QTA38490.1 D-sedoheptulose 7-phosphate isomerase [Thermosipho ferrireducens]
MGSNLVVKKLKESIEVKSKILSDKELIKKIENSAELIVRALKNGKKVIFCGNGGSAADAQHLAAELMGKFYFNRPPLPAFSLTVNTSVLTAIGNDFGYEKVFVRQLQGISEKGDVIVGISTSGNSKNVIEAFKYAKNIGMNVIAFTGKNGGKMKDYADVLINVPSEDTPRIQESHITIGHIICGIVESAIFNEVIK